MAGLNKTVDLGELRREFDLQLSRALEGSGEEEGEEKEENDERQQVGRMRNHPGVCVLCLYMSLRLAALVSFVCSLRLRHMSGCLFLPSVFMWLTDGLPVCAVLLCALPYASECHLPPTLPPHRLPPPELRLPDTQQVEAAVPRILCV